MIALAACVAGILGLPVPDTLPHVFHHPQAVIAGLASRNGAAAGHGRGKRIEALYYRPGRVFKAGFILMANEARGNNALMAHELAHHVVYSAGGDWRDESAPTWVQRKVRDGACR